MAKEGGTERIRTAGRAFAELCLATWPRCRSKKYNTQARSVSRFAKGPGVAYNRVNYVPFQRVRFEEAMRDVIDNGRLTWRLINDPRVPTLVKVTIPLLVALYFFSPLDFIPDFLPILGQLDDIGVILFGMSLIVRFSPQDVVDEHRRALGFNSADGDRSAQNIGTDPSSYWAGPPTRHPSEPTRPIDGEYTVVPPQQ